MKTLIIGASTKPSRYSYKATERLLAAGREVVLIGGRVGEVLGLPIQVGKPAHLDIDTVTVYLAKANQEEYIDYIVNEIKPRRIIFNPGAENHAFAETATAAGIEVVHGCTLVMLASNQY